MNESSHLPISKKQDIFHCCYVLSLNALSAKCGITQSTMNNIVSGRNNSTTISTVQKLCDGLNMTIPAFFDSELFLNLEQEIL